MKREAAGLVVVEPDRATGFHRGGCETVVDQFNCCDVRRIRERDVDRFPVPALPVDADIGRCGVPDQRGYNVRRASGIDVGR